MNKHHKKGINGTKKRFYFSTSDVLLLVLNCIQRVAVQMWSTITFLSTYSPTKGSRTLVWGGGKHSSKLLRYCRYSTIKLMSSFLKDVIRQIISREEPPHIFAELQCPTCCLAVVLKRVVVYHSRAIFGWITTLACWEHISLIAAKSLILAVAELSYSWC